MYLYIFLSIYVVISCSIFRRSIQRQSRLCRGFFVVITYGMMLLLLGLRRYDVGNDTLAYSTFFREIGSGNISYDERIESGFRYFTKIIGTITHSEQLYVLICTISVFFPVLLFFRKVNDELEINIALFWFLGCFSFCSAARQGIAIAIILMGYLCLRKKTVFCTIIYCLCCILASSFHSIAIVMIALPIFRRWKVSLRIMIVLVGISLVLTQTNIINWIFMRFVGDYYSNYLNVQSGWMAALFNAFIGVFGLYIDSTSRNYNKNTDCKIMMNSNLDDSILRWSTLLYTVSWILSVNSSAMGRMAAYFAPFVIVYISRSLKNSRFSEIFYYAICFALGGYNVLALIIRPEWNSFFPYHFFWQ